MAFDLTYNVLKEVAHTMRTDVYDLPPLGQTIDPEAVEQLFNEASESVEISFDYADCTVVIRGGDSPRITAAPHPSQIAQA